VARRIAQSRPIRRGWRGHRPWPQQTVPFGQTPCEQRRPWRFVAQVEPIADSGRTAIHVLQGSRPTQSHRIAVGVEAKRITY